MAKVEVELYFHLKIMVNNIVYPDYEPVQLEQQEQQEQKKDFYSPLPMESNYDTKDNSHVSKAKIEGSKLDKYRKIYEQNGWRCVPIQEGEKRPRSGLTEWQTIPFDVCVGLKYKKGEGIGNIINEDFIVFDVDKPKKDEYDGASLLAELAQQYEEEDIKTPTCITGSGGKHMYFKIDDKLREALPNICKTRVSKIWLYGEDKPRQISIDIKLKGGQVIMPPTIHPNGNAYKWAKDKGPKIPMIPMPKWLLDLCNKHIEEFTEEGDLVYIDREKRQVKNDNGEVKVRADNVGFGKNEVKEMIEEMNQYGEPDDFEEYPRPKDVEIIPLQDEGEFPWANTIEYVKDTVALLDECRATDSEDWYKVMGGLKEFHKRTGINCFDIADTFSQRTTSDNYKKSRVRQLYEDQSFKKHTFASIVKLAKEDDSKGYKEVMKKHMDLYNKKNDKKKEDEVEVLDDNTFAKDFVKKIKDDIKITDLDNGSGYRWSEKQKIWKSIHTKEIRSLITDILQKPYMKKINDLENKMKEMKKEDKKDEKKQVRAIAKNIDNLTKILKYLGSASGCRAILALAEPMLYDEKFEEKLDKIIEVYPTADGKILDFKTLELRERTKEDYCSFHYDGIYDKNESTEEAKKFMKSVYQTDDLIDYMTEASGLWISGKNNRGLAVFYGPTCRNGKSTQCNIYEKLLGKSYVALSNDVFIKSKSHKAQGAVTAHLVSLTKHPRIGMCSEVNKGDEFDCGQLKKLTGGDQMVANPKYLEEIKFICKTNLILQVNKDVPSFPAHDDGVKDRFVYIPFRSRFTLEQKDGEMKANEQWVKDLKTKYLNQFLKLYAEGAQRALNRGHLIEPDIIKQTCEALFDEEDMINPFLKERCEIGEGKSVLLNDLHNEYKDFVGNNDKVKEYRDDSRKFNARLKTKVKNYNSKKTTKGSKITGICLKEEEDE